jgi:predicted phage baseplate assembly protein
VNSRLSPSLVEHPRSAHEIAAVLDRMLDDVKFAPPGTDQLRDALVQIAARYGEIVTQCLNASPDLHLEAFAELLGGHARPAAAARVHVSFKPAPGAARRSDEASLPIPPGRGPVPVSTYTRLAAQAGGSGEPAIFETLADLDLVRAEAVRALFVDAGHRRVAQLDAIASGAGFGGDVLSSFTPVNYALHIGQRAAFNVPGLQRVRVQVDVRDAGSRDPFSQLEWIVATPNGDIALEVEQDTTDGLSHSGEVVLVPPSAWPAVPVNGIESLWLTLRLRHQLEAAAPASQWRPPRLAALGIRVVAVTGPQPATAACHETIPLDISKDFLPFGERPRFGAVFQVLCPVFGEPGARVEMVMRLTNPEGATAAPIPPVSREGHPTVVWEIATTNGFQAIVANDGTQSLTQDGSLVFTVPNDVASIIIAGKTGPWLRARLASGHYGSMPATDGTAIVVMRAPAVKSIAVRSTLERGPLPPEQLVSQGALTSVHIDPSMPSAVDAFPSPDVGGPVLYIGLDALGGAPGALDVLAKGYVISWHVRPTPPTPPIIFGEPAPSSAAPRCQMRTADGWRDTTMHDGSAGLTQSGIVTLTLQDEPGEWRGGTLDPAARKLAWLRIIWPAEQVSRAIPELPIGLTINSVLAQHSQHLTNEIVGSSNGRKNQVFKALRTPIIGDVVLQVREVDDDWVTWNEVDTLAASRAETRDFTVDRSTGELRFGDGRFGRIPLPGANNVRLHQYATGGGRLGNQPAKAIAQMRNAVPSVESVVNLEPATGGLDAEDAARVRAHASAWLRHRDRAVCADDFADLALKASPEVARAICVAGRDLGVAAPDGIRELETQPGVVSTIVIPRTTDPSPQPSLDLLKTVKDYIDARRSPAGRLVIVGPTYTRVSVRLQVMPTVGWPPDGVANECKRRIAEFLHPLAGGPNGCGWALGQRPHRSDLYGLLDAIDGVDFVRGLSLSIDAPTGMPIIVMAGTIDVEPVREP